MSTELYDLQSDGSAAAVGTPQASLGELLEPSARKLAYLYMLAGLSLTAGAMAKHHPDPNWPSVAPGLVLVVCGFLCLKLAHSSTAARAWVCSGLFVAAVAELVVSGVGMTHQMAMAATLVVGVLAGPPLAIAVAAVLATVASLALPSAAALAVVGDVSLAALVVWAVGQSIYDAVVHAETSEMRAWELAGEAMRRRGEAQRSAKMLHDMYALLERTNHELEEARREAEDARAVKARFAATISHELRTPLNLIMGFSRMMYRSPHVYGDVRWTPPLRLDVHEIYRASRHLLGMIDDILDLARIEAQRLPLKLESSDLATLAEEAAATARGLLRDATVSFNCELQAGLPPVMVDRTRIRQVLLNLLNNAIRFTDSGSITLRVAQSGREVEATVSDTGVGIAANELDSIFDEFSQAGGALSGERGGAGLGLAVCKQVVQLHGGRIWARSELGKGSTFGFSIPIPESGAARSRLAYYAPDGWQPPLPDNPLGHAVVILAPDDASARVVARGITGYRVLISHSLDGLDDLVTREHPDGIVILRDPLAPEGSTPAPADVWQLTGRPDLGVVECEMPIESLARRHLGVAGYLSKPVEPEQLLELLQSTAAMPERLLLVDDDHGFRSLLQRVVTSAYPSSQCRGCGSVEEALAELRRAKPDVMLLDLVLARGSGIDLLRLARAEGLLDGVRVVVITGASYVEELANLFPARIRFSKLGHPPTGEWLDCIRALLQASPADYTRPVHVRARQGDPRPQPAS